MTTAIQDQGTGVDSGVAIGEPAAAQAGPAGRPSDLRRPDLPRRAARQRLVRAHHRCWPSACSSWVERSRLCRRPAGRSSPRPRGIPTRADVRNRGDPDGDGARRPRGRLLRVPPRLRHCAVHLGVRPAAHQAPAHHDRRPDGRGAVDRLRHLGVPAAAVADRAGRPLDLHLLRVDPDLRRRRSGSGGPAVFCDGVQLQRVHRRDRRRAHGHTDRHVGDARGVHPGPSRRARGRLRAGRHEVGDGAVGRPALRPRRHHRRHHARPRPCARRDDRGLPDPGAGLRPRLPHPAEQRQRLHRLGAHRPRYGESTPFATSALFAAGLSLFILTLIINFAAGAIVARSRSGAGAEA